VGVASDIVASPCPPCGICRQFLREFVALSTPIYMPLAGWKEGDKVEVRTLEQLLPLSFGPDDLDKQK
jgi:cytidine deaminase